MSDHTPKFHPINTPRATPRPAADRALAEHLMRRVRGEIDRARLAGPVRRTTVAPPTEQDVFDRVADALLNQIAGESDQPLPFDRAAGRVERATDTAFDRN